MTYLEQFMARRGHPRRSFSTSWVLSGGYIFTRPLDRFFLAFNAPDHVDPSSIL